MYYGYENDAAEKAMYRNAIGVKDTNKNFMMIRGLKDCLDAADLIINEAAGMERSRKAFIDSRYP